MWKLEYKESWAQKNWCFWTVVLEKTLESPLDCKEIQPVHPKGDQFSSVKSVVVSDSLRPHEPQNARPPCPSPTPRVYSDSCPLSWWCHLTILSSVIPFSSCLHSFPTSGSFQMSQPFAKYWSLQWKPKYWSFSFNISPCNEHPGLVSFRMDWLDLPAV